MSSGPTGATRQLVLKRDQYRCQWCGVSVDPQGGWYSLQHRRARGMGGTKRKDSNQAHNLVTVCGSATTGCHGYMESHPVEAVERGFRISQHQDPATVPILLFSFGLSILEPDGTHRKA